jgi:hypothetical protein
MDAQRFDHLTRMIARRTSRRTLLRGAGAGAVLSMLGGAGLQPARAAVCAEGQLDCGGVCIDTCCDNANCGGCGIVCTSGQTCFEGVCDCPSGLCCAAGQTQCGDACIDTCCDNANCGGCGIVCGAGETCFEGVCDCPSGTCGTTGGSVTLPGTGSGPSRSTDGPVAVALVGTGMALAATGWRRLMRRPDAG